MSYASRLGFLCRGSPGLCRGFSRRAHGLGAASLASPTPSASRRRGSGQELAAGFGVLTLTGLPVAARLVALSRRRRPLPQRGPGDAAPLRIVLGIESLADMLIAVERSGACCATQWVGRKSERARAGTPVVPLTVSSVGSISAAVWRAHLRSGLTAGQSELDMYAGAAWLKSCSRSPRARSRRRPPR